MAVDVDHQKRVIAGSTSEVQRFFTDLKWARRRFCVRSLQFDEAAVACDATLDFLLCWHTAG